MNSSAWVIPAVIALLVSGVFFAGCSDESPATSESAAQATITAAPTTSGALYSEGDIVKNPKSSLNTGLLIISYDAATDMYERALIYPYSDGRWGYRVDSATSKMSRSNVERVYTDKVSTVSVSSVTIGAPTTVTTVTTATTTATATATTAAGYAPKVKSIEPDFGNTSSNVSISELAGNNFKSGAKVTLKKSGATTITATDVAVESVTKITCKFIIPSDASTGYYDVVVTNSDGQSDAYENSFTIKQGITTTSTTSSAAATKVTITQIQDTKLVTANLASTKDVNILGTNLSAAYNMRLTGPSTIAASGYTAGSSTAKGIFNLPAGSVGTYHVDLVDSSGNVLATSSGTLEISSS